MTRSLGLILALALLAGCSSTEEDETGNATFRKGLQLAEAGDVAGAIRAFEAGVGEHPGHTRMRFELARLQYESGEAHHTRERRAIVAGAGYMEIGQRDQALANQREANEARAKATPYYQAARDNLRVVVDDESDPQLCGWAYYLLMRVDVFFEDWEAAVLDCEKAIELGKPTGHKLAQMREYQQGLKDRRGVHGD